MARKENQIMMNDSIQLTLSKSQFEEQLLQIRQKIESQQFPRHCVIAAFEQLKLQAKTLLTRRLNNNNNYSNLQTQNQVGSANNLSNQSQLDVDSHLFKLFQEISQQVSAIQQQMPYQSCISTNQNAQLSSKQVCNNNSNNSASFNLFSNNFWEGDKHSFDSGSTVSYFHDEAKAETGDEHLFHGFFEDEHNSDSQNQKLNTSGSNSYSNNYNQYYSIDLANQNNNRTNKQFPIINQFNVSQQSSLWGDILNEQRQIGNSSESIVNTNLISTFANNAENIIQNNGSACFQGKDRSPINNFGDASAEEFYDEDDDDEQNDQQKHPISTKSYSSNSLNGIITTNNAVSSSITNIKKGKKANLMHNLKNQLKKTNCCNFDTNDDEDEDEEEYEEYQEYYHQKDIGKNSDEKQNHQSNDQMFQLQIEENQRSSKTIKVNEHSNFLENPTRSNVISTNQFDPRLFDSHNQKISFSSAGGGGFNYEDLKNDVVEKQEQEQEEHYNAKLTGSGQGIHQFQQNSLSNYTSDLKNISQTGQFTAQSQLNSLQSSNINSELQNYIQCEEIQKLDKNDSEDKGHQEDEEFINESDYDEYDEEDETYNSNLDVVGLRESFQEGEKLNFMASQRIHYYKTDDFNEILNERSPFFEQHCENVRNIIMTMSNNYGGLIMFGLGKNKLVQGITLSQKEKQDFIKFMTNIKNSIHNSKQLFCKVSYFPIYRQNPQPKPLNTNNSNQKENLQSPLNQQQNIKPQAPTTNTTTHFKLFDQVPPADFSLFSENPNSSNNNYPPLLLFDSDSQNEQDILFTPFYSSIDPKKNIYASNAGTNFYYGQNDANNKAGSNAESSFQQSWNFQTSNWSLETSQNSKRKCSGDTKQWISDKYIIRVFIDQGQKLDATYVYIKNKEITSAIYDKKLKIFKAIYGEPLLNKILSKAQNPSIQAQKLNLAEPDKEGLQASCPFTQQQQQQAQQQQAANYQVNSLEKPFSLLSTSLSNNQMQSKTQQQINSVSPINPPGLSVKNTKESNLNEEYSPVVNEAFKAEECQKELNNSNSLPLTQEYIKQKRGLKILNDSKKRQIKEKNQKKSQQNLSSKSNSRESYSNLSDDSKVIPIVKYNLIEFVGFEHSDNAKSFRDQIERQIGICQVECGIAKYDTLFFKVNDSFSSVQQNKDQADILSKQNSQKQQTQLNKKSGQYNAIFGNSCNNNINLSNNSAFFNSNMYGINNINSNLENTSFINNNNNNSSNLSQVDKQYEWMEKLYNYLLTGDYWKQLIQKERIFKKLVIDGIDYFTEESNQWLCFQNVKNKNHFTSQISQLIQKNVIEKVNLYHQHVFIINKYKEFEKFSSSNKQFQQCFLQDIIKKGFSSSNIVVKSLKNSHRGQDSFKQLLNNFKFQISQQGSNFFVCQFQSPLDSFLAMERLINHRKQKFIIDLFTTNALDAVIELQDNFYNPQQQQQQQQQLQQPTQVQESQPKTQ
ncbi:hypothetical protein ABPG72_013119 [Tetrahymena utriculariae]